MVRDLTATPGKHLLIQSTVLVWMGAAAYLVTALPAVFSFLINFFTLLLILYAFTYEYSSHMYFPYILSYLFLIFISPVHAGQLPGRLLGMLAGAISIMLYQWVMGRNRVRETARDVLSEMIDDICQYTAQRTAGNAQPPDLSAMRRKLCRLSRTVYERRKKALCVSDASFSLIDTGRGLEHLLILIQELPETLSEQDKIFLSEIIRLLNEMRIFLQQEGHSIPPAEDSLFSELKDNETAKLFFNSFIYIRDRLLHMTDPHNRTRYKKTALSLRVRLQAALDLSPVRAVYALRTALLLSCATLLVQSLALPHGKWFLFTLASVSLPYADDVPLKMKKRFLATVIGGLLSVVIYAVIPSSAGRTAVMMLSGYISFYFTDYTETFTCSTIGALGGAVFMSAFDFQAIGNIFLIRIGYIIAGIAVAYVINCLFFPYTRAMATRHLMKKYKSITELLTKVCHSDHADPQLYYNLVIQAHLQEEKLSSNAYLEDWKDFQALITKYREQVRQAHRSRIPERANAPVFESGHLTT